MPTPKPTPTTRKKNTPKASPTTRWLFPLLVLLFFTLGVWAATPYFFPQKNPGNDNPNTPGTLGYALTQLDN